MPGVIAGPAGLEWLDAHKPQLVQIETVDEHVDRSHRVVLAYIIVERCRKKCALPPTNSFNKALHSDAPAQPQGILPRESLQTERFHTAWANSGSPVSRAPRDDGPPPATTRRRARWMSNGWLTTVFRAASWFLS